MGADRPKSLMFCVHVFLSIQSLSGVAGIGMTAGSLSPQLSYICFLEFICKRRMTGHPPYVHVDKPILKPRSQAWHSPKSSTRTLLDETKTTRPQHLCLKYVAECAGRPDNRVGVGVRKIAMLRFANACRDCHPSTEGTRQ